MNTAATGFGSAISSDLVNWTKEATNPIFRIQNTSGNWTTEIACPYWRKFGTEYRIYYTGYKNGQSLIGLARKFNKKIIDNILFVLFYKNLHQTLNTLCLISTVYPLTDCKIVIKGK